MFALSFTCQTCVRTHRVFDAVGGEQQPILRCPQCDTEYVWSRLRGQKRAGWHKPFSCVELVVFPHNWSTEYGPGENYGVSAARVVVEAAVGERVFETEGGADDGKSLAAGGL